MTKYRQYFEKMLSENKTTFAEFRQLHARYGLNEDGLQAEFNQEGKKILAIIRDYEDRLCKNSEKTYSMFTGNLSEKFWSEIRKEFPLIDHIGIIAQKQPAFNLKKISLR